jgi:heme exporter protein C
MWGAWWVWDARLTSELILLFLYLGYIALHSAITQKERARQASSILALVGLINIPVIHYSVEWWNTLHQGPTLSKLEKPSIHASMLWPLLSMIGAFMVYFWVDVLNRARAQLLLLEYQCEWVRRVIRSRSAPPSQKDRPPVPPLYPINQ